ncbi:MAG TPA: pitrilysin family protein [Casimicrobiaceae bacterium]|jgi:zinc protease|nr:pitrilysin family protein [Casimicrobiaceae bacterium]
MRLAPLVRSSAFLIVALFALAARAALPGGVTQGPTVEGVTQYELANGMRVVLFPDATKPTTTVNITYLVGSRFEGYGETGMAHLLEHMLFKGTPAIPSVFAELGRRGMRFNGTTWFDRTHFYESFAANDDNLAWALKMESERMTKSTFSKAELDKEMTVVRNEFEMGENDAENILSQRVQSVMYDWHNYAHDTIGARSDIENVPFANLRAFYTKYYQPDNAVLVVAGKFDVARTLALIAQDFGPIPRPSRVLAPLYTVEPVQDGERSVTLNRVGSEQWVSAAFHGPAGPSADGPAMAALAAIMSIEPSGRLYKALVETHKAVGVQGAFYELHDPGFAMFEAQVAVGQPVAPARDAMIATLMGVKDAPITQEELDRVRAKEIKAFTETINDPARFGVGISESIAQGDWRLLFINRDRWRALKPGDVTKAALDYLKRSNMTLGEFVPVTSPERAPLPPKVDIAGLVAGYKGDAAVAAGEAFDTSIQNLEARTQRVTLPGGMKVALLPRKTRGGTVDVSLRMQYGDEKSMFGQSTLASATAAMLSKGTTTRSRQAYDDQLDAMLARLAFGADGQQLVASGRTVKMHLDDFLALMADALRNPAFAPDETDKQKREWLAAIEQGRTDPGAITEREIARVNNPYPRGDLRYQPTLDEDLADVNAVTPAAMKAFHDRFYGASNAEIAIVGDFDAAHVKAEVAKLFGDWKAQEPFVRVPNPFIPNKTAALTFDTPDKANAALRGRLSIPISDRSADFAAMLVANRALGGGEDSRLFERVRVHDGLAYDVGSGLLPSSLDDNSTLVSRAIFAPQNFAKVKGDFAEELARATGGGFTDAEIASAKQSLLEERRLPRGDDRVLAASLTYQLYLGRTWAESGHIDDAIGAVTRATADAALRKYVDPAQFAYVYAGAFGKQ